jgi:hypothetical protein
MTVDQLLEPAPVSAPPRRGRWVLAFVLLLVFVSGGIVGGGGTDYMHRNGWSRLMRFPGEVPDRLVPMLRGKLDLNDEQTGKVDHIVRERHREIEKLRAEVQPRIDHQIDEMQSEIDAVLEPGQRDRWHEWVQSLRRRWGPEHHSRHHHGPRSSHGREGDASWQERHSGRGKSKGSAVGNDAADSAVEKPTDEPPNKDAAVIKDAPADADAAKLPAASSAVNPASPDGPEKQAVPPAKTDP